MPLLGLDAYAYPFVAVKIEVAALALPDPGLLCDVAGRHGVLEGKIQETRAFIKGKCGEYPQRAVRKK